MKEFKIVILRVLVVVGVLLALAVPSVTHADANSTDSTDSTAAPSSNSTSDKSSTDSSSSSGSSTDKSSGSTSDKSSTESSSSSDATAQNTEKETEVQIEDTNTKDGQQYIANLSKEHGSQSSAAITQNCQAAQQGLETKLKSLQANATAFDNRINSVYSQALAYQKSSGTNPSNFSTLVATASADQLSAQAAVAALNSLSVTLNCSSSTVANNVAIFRAATSQARTYLVTYQNSVYKVLVALEI